MDTKKILSSKSVKLLALLLTLLITSVSALVYYSMLMQPSVTIYAAPVRFAEGDDWLATVGSTLGNNATWVNLGLKAYPNATLIYEDPLNISNTDASNTYQFRLRHMSITPASGSAQVSNFTFINFVVKNKAGVVQGDFNYTTGGTDTWSTPGTTGWFGPVPVSTQWIIYVETRGAASANLGIAVNIQIAVESQ